MGLREKYSQAIQTAKSVGMQGQADERDGKLHFKGTTKTQDEANRIWDSIKTVPDWPKEIVADIQAATPRTPPSGATAAARTYTVKAGDTLSKIAAAHGKSWQQLAQQNGLANPNALKVGQSLTV